MSYIGLVCSGVSRFGTELWSIRTFNRNSLKIKNLSDYCRIFYEKKYMENKDLEFVNISDFYILIQLIVYPLFALLTILNRIWQEIFGIANFGSVKLRFYGRAIRRRLI